MDPDDALIDLLNGFSHQRGFNGGGGGNSDRAFLDDAGIPTDSFLQALKHDFSSFSYLDDQSPAKDIKSSKTPRAAPRRSANAEESDFSSFSYLDDTDIKASKTPRAAPRRSAKPKETDVSVREERGVSNAKYRDSHPPALPPPLPPVEEEEDTKVETDLKIKSLQLRVTGQLRTIRVLETQLAETQSSLESRSQLVVQVESRLKQLEPRERTTSSHKAKSMEDARQLSAKADEKVERYKVIDFVSRSQLFVIFL